MEVAFPLPAQKCMCKISPGKLCELQQRIVLLSRNLTSIDLNFTPPTPSHTQWARSICWRTLGHSPFPAFCRQHCNFFAQIYFCIVYICCLYILATKRECKCIGIRLAKIRNTKLPPLFTTKLLLQHGWKVEWMETPISWKVFPRSLSILKKRERNLKWSSS